MPSSAPEPTVPDSPIRPPGTEFRVPQGRTCGRPCARPAGCSGNPSKTWGFRPPGLTGAPPSSKMRSRRTRQGESDPGGPTNHRRKELSSSDRRRSVESLVKPPRRVRGGPRPRWSPRGTAGRPQARRCRGRKGSERLKGRSGVDRTKHQPGPGRTRLRRRRRATEAERVWNGDGVSGTPGPSGAVGRRKERECRIPPGISGRVGLGFGDRRVAENRVRVQPPGEASRVRIV